MSPRVSVIIPAFNAERYLTEALDSVAAQTRAADEVIVVDDDSTDGTAEIVARRDDAVVYCHQAHNGAAAARNRGVRVAMGEFLTFLDADDTWAHDKLERQLAAFDREPDLDMVFGRVVQFHSPDVEVASGAPVNDVSEPLDGYHPGVMMVRRAAFTAIGPFREDQQIGDFIDWYARAVEQHHNMTMLPEVLAYRRLHETNFGRQAAGEHDAYARVLRTVLERRRRSTS